MQYQETNQVDPYVRLTLFDPSTGGTEAFRTSTQMNDASPRLASVVQLAPFVRPLVARARAGPCLLLCCAPVLPQEDIPGTCPLYCCPSESTLAGQSCQAEAVLIGGALLVSNHGFSKLHMAVSGCRVTPVSPAQVEREI